jgi:polygalacturonase
MNNRLLSARIFLFSVTSFLSACSLFKQNKSNAEVKISIIKEAIKVDAPFKMPALHVIKYPDRVFNIKDYGAVEGGVFLNRDIISNVIKTCNEAGGGTVVIPDGKWLTGKIHFKSNVNLHLQDSAELIFSDDFNEYLPAVQSSWEGMECFNYSPLIYAFNCSNITLSGKGKLIAVIGKWKDWYERPPLHMQGLKTLYEMAVKKVPVADRDMTKEAYHFRPQFIQFNRCTDAVIENLSIKNSPFWTVHLYLCNGVIVRGLDIYAHGHNNDGIDPEMTKNLLIENCIFDQGDDAVAIKSGRDQDGWRLNTPTENVVIRNCIVKDGHQLLAVGSEISGGIRNIYLHDCTIPPNNRSSLNNIIFIKTNAGRGGFIEHIYVKNIKADKLAAAVLGVATDVFYQWKDLVPVYEKRLTKISDIRLSDIEVREADIPFSIKGDSELPVAGVDIKNIRIIKSFKKESVIQNVTGVQQTNVQVGSKISP